MSAGAMCAAISNYCEEAQLCSNCVRQYGCAKRKTNETRPNRNKHCFICKYMKAATLGVECTKKDR